MSAALKTLADDGTRLVLALLVVLMVSAVSGASLKPAILTAALSLSTIVMTLDVEFKSAKLVLVVPPKVSVDR